MRNGEEDKVGKFVVKEANVVSDVPRWMNLLHELVAKGGWFCAILNGAVSSILGGFSPQKRFSRVEVNI